ncbi:MAG: transporter [Gammaproteobacteria bacterium]|nr:transporter [Gammaproteobacteria bacterium]
MTALVRPLQRQFRISLILLAVASLLNQMDRFVLSVLAQPIIADLRLTDTEFGLLTGLAFAIFYAVCGIPLARIADRGDRPKLLASCLILWTLATAISGLAMGFAQMLAARITVAVGEAGTQPAIFSLTRNIGSSIGISVVQTLLTRNTQIMHATLGEHVTRFSPILRAQLAGRSKSSHHSGKFVLDALSQDAGSLAAQTHALATAQSSLELSRRSYGDGNTGILQILDGQRQRQQAQLGFVRAQAQQYLDTTQLFVALGGGGL